LAGTVFFVVLLRWLDFTFQSYSSIPWPLTWLPITALAAYCGLYVGMVTGVVASLRSRLGAGWALAAAPPLWVAGEWIRGWLMGGFPWGLLGYSQHTALPGCQSTHTSASVDIAQVVAGFNSHVNPDMESFSCEEALDCLFAIYKVSRSNPLNVPS